MSDKKQRWVLNRVRIEVWGREIELNLWHQNEMVPLLSDWGQKRSDEICSRHFIEVEMKIEVERQDVRFASLEEMTEFAKKKEDAL